MADKILQFEIVTPERVLVKENILQVTAPTVQGEITILPGHIPLVSVLASGVLEIARPDKSRTVISVSGGFIQVAGDKVVILADTAEKAEEIDLVRVEEAKARAVKTKNEAKTLDTRQFTALSAKISKELARSQAVKRWKKLNNLN
ncbi:ATP synthase F1 subunit epsilon [Candidatus Falkowbacteria bacterium CG_4_10_14_0_2_um_filter_48_10]|uniref:ATP synthase epsilon chain n=1 Tax=Candidatus Falkowbacteria bacterium CG23_combo_of_CG06-09_8_20_14_all_49_15 TaxID=1974572 RepID=A0A2G9ZM35_9BACT|nr:MAG: ATP synthase F1 subunit epsilon [Candidatus Falkowbacteria bacterium CG23_combo_of_CG06-09_8_20_14_all_49_15]PJA08610.1 MAG: ATP synthase F1 subunit epsilon [Candidatus Falkowbacteria bacterium CG_4_10_14_0_2_um_filter_48_10]